MTTPESIQKPTYPQFTNLALKEGLFDQLMATVDFHLDKQYSQNRMRGTDYANVYVGSIQGVMQFTTQYLLGVLFADEQKDKIGAEISLITKQELKLDKEIDLAELEAIRMKYTIEELLPLEKEKLVLEVERVRQEGLLIAAQITKITAEIAHMAAQQALWVKEGLKIDAEILFLDAQKDMMLKQALKIDKEIEFLTWKITTEQANTQEGIAHTDSLIGRQMSLLSAQKYGFAGDLKIKAGKLHADYDAVVQGVHELVDVAVLSQTGSGAAGLAGEASTIANSIAIA